MNGTDQQPTPACQGPQSPGFTAASQSDAPGGCSCDDVESLLPLVADGALDAASDPALFAHLARCCACQEALVQHDLVTIALEETRPAATVLTPARREPIRHVFLPWPAALAASLAAAAGLWMWLGTLNHARVQSPAPATQVVQVMSADGQPVYVVVQGEQVTVIDPRAIDGRSADGQQQVQAVKFNAPKR